MPFTLIMKRKVFRIVQEICEQYEEKFKEKIPTAHIVNVLLTEALIHRGLIPKEYLKEMYGCDDPIDMGFTANARKEKPKHIIEQEQEKLRQIEKILKGALEQWDTLTENAKAYHLKTAMQHKELTVSQQILRKEGVINE